MSPIFGNSSSKYLSPIVGLFSMPSKQTQPSVSSSDDVDVDVLIKSERKCRRNILIDGLEVEMFIHPPIHVYHLLTSDPNGIHLRCYTFGRVIYDPNNLFPQLQRIAKLRWENGPPVLEAKDYWRPRYEIADLLRDLEDCDFVNDEATAHFLLVKLVERLVRIQGCTTTYSLVNVNYYFHNSNIFYCSLKKERLYQRWPEKLKRCCQTWESWDAVGGRLAKHALNSNVKWIERIRCSKELAKYVLAPIGGVMPIEWTMDWEEIPDVDLPYDPLILPKIESIVDEFDEKVSMPLKSTTPASTIMEALDRLEELIYHLLKSNDVHMVALSAYVSSATTSFFNSESFIARL
ncbi:18985_t:CDS:2 [Racocetra persica]|uniref:18985_t:CDS:1 n=1 Tax=Racocetra persica TaxID=160502 RepID=A0ACA9M607_9GLOM|nr:18985_t:CDS:2 [Racocetra persica]